MLIAFAVAAFSGCSNKQDANEKNFSAAINQFFDKKGDLCLTYFKWPWDIDQTWGSRDDKGLLALKSEGLVSSSDIEIDQATDGKLASGRKIKVKRYVLTEKGNKFSNQKEVTRQGFIRTKVMATNICYGKVKLEKIEKWDEPSKYNGMQIANVKYRYKIEGLADWAKNADIQSNFGAITSILNGAEKEQRQQTVKLTNQGWEVIGLDD